MFVRPTRVAVENPSAVEAAGLALDYLWAILDLPQAPARTHGDLQRPRGRAHQPEGNQEGRG